jgi:hypothetical protein
VPYSSDFISHYWERVDQLGPLPPHNEALGRCWPWKGGTSVGYGIVYVPGGKPRRAHQISWELHDLGEIPEGYVIRHECDNRLCVNPDHLILGTRGDNNRDTHSRGRWIFVPAGQGRRREPQRRGPKPGDVAARFWLKVDKDGPVPAHDPSLGSCWLWTSAVDARGYGAFFMPGKPRMAPKAKAHRVSFELAHGPIPEGLDVLHHCDVRHCVNPKHLYLGTDRENMRDAVERGRRRSRAGEDNPNAKLSDAEVSAIRRIYASGQVTQTALAEQFGVSQKHISALVRGQQRRVEV